MPYKNREDRIKYLKEYRIKKIGILSQKRKQKYLTKRDVVLAEKRKHYQKNKEEINKNRREKYKSNPKKIIDQVKRYYLNNKEKVHARQKEWIKKNRDLVRKKAKINHRKYYLNNRDKLKIKAENYLKANPEISNVRNANGTAKRFGLGGKITLKDWKSIKLRQKDKCAMCKLECNLTIDHIIPKTKWIEWSQKYNPYFEYNSVQNIQGLCMSCNISKSNKIIKEERIAELKV